ncbi:low temperature requirement protein A [Thalassotalea mangrovi]|uniref:Low temperature requirement protein A n=1 Tax=Thalassotalea mangrovi TaxID=2572245 RepID=A0A4U1B5H8_9GAMM|nr:low temperature requirement protein A [Thalassotalea mangrovi]TKB45556.1 low temperature requirement protein A [Thalassotalea mangrovi]
MARFFTPLTARDNQEPHRTATTLELFFDLVFVVAIATAAHGFANHLVAGEVGDGIAKFIFAYLCIWWAWNQFTWFASSFDNDSPAYRISVLLMMVGAMLIAASMDSLFQKSLLLYTYLGYVLMRVPFVFLWLRVALDNPELRSKAVFNAISLILLQVYWGWAALGVHDNYFVVHPIFLIGWLLEFCAPVIAEKIKHSQWHPDHIQERFGLLMIIVLGEVIVANIHALTTAIDGGPDLLLFAYTLVTISLVFAMWWYYFCDQQDTLEHCVCRAFSWSYGHFFIFLCAVMVGSGLTYMHHGYEEHHVGQNAALTVSIPIGLFIVSIWFVRDRLLLCRKGQAIVLLLALLLMATGFLPYGLVIATILLIGIVVYRQHMWRTMENIDRNLSD